MGKKLHCVYSDTISNVPDDVITRILSCLSLKEAARTSLLSKQWRYRWTSMPKLVFDDAFSSLSKGDLFKTICHVLLSHPQPITSFSLCVSSLKSCVEIDQILLFLSNRQIQEFTLVMNNGERHRLSSSMFSFEQLCHLILVFCVFRIPSSFEGFFNLKSIHFEDVDFNGNSFKQILSLCPFVEDITMLDCINFESLVVGTPKLQHLDFSGDTEIICFTMSPVLSKLHIYPQSYNVSVLGDIVESFACLPSLQTLSLTDLCILAFFNYGPIPHSLPTKLDSLKVLRFMDVSWETLSDVSVMLCLIKSSPNLENLEIEFCGRGSEFDGTPAANFLEAQDLYDSFSKLRELKLEWFEGLKNEMVFVKMVLGNAPNLELLDIQPCKMDVKCENRILVDLTKFVRASSRATIVFHCSAIWC